MKRISALLAAALLLAILVGPAAEAGPRRTQSTTKLVSGVVTKRPSAIRAYWTAARMRNATPVTQQLSGEPSDGTGQTEAEGAYGRVRPFRPASVRASHARQMGDSYALTYEVTAPYTQFPYSTHGKVFFTDPSTGSNYVCSGTAVNSENKSIVWTAGHCVNGGGGPWMTNWAFAPARKDGSNPFGLWTARELWSTSAWATYGNIRYDMGAVVMNLNNGSRLVNVVGGRGIAWNASRNQYFFSHGHPAAPPYSGERMFICESGLVRNDYPFGGSGPATMGIYCDMTGGSSGGGWAVNGALHSVNSYGYSNQPGIMYGPYHGDAAASLYNAVRNR